MNFPPPQKKVDKELRGIEENKRKENLTLKDPFGVTPAM